MYWYFAAERQAMFYRRLDQQPPPWTTDPILTSYRFTNVYRAADRVSQFLIRDVIYGGEQSITDVFFRTILFKLFNKIETWRLLEEQLGEIAWATFDFGRYVSVLDRAIAAGGKIYSAAYIIPSPNLGSPRKHINHLQLLMRTMREGVDRKIAAASSLAEVYHILRSLPSIGNFLAFQFAIDLNYSEAVNFEEGDYVVAGPGAHSGIRKAFVHTAGLTDEDLIHEVTMSAPREFSERGLAFRNLWGRPLQPIDCQNLFCEVDKYARAALPSTNAGGRTRIKRRYACP
jgi:hypothetical protein